MAWVDWIIVAVVSLSVLLGLIRGVVRELIALCGLILAAWLAYQYAGDVGARLPLGDAVPAARTLAAGVLIFIGVVFGAALVGWVVQKLLAIVKLSTPDRALGALFGLLRAGLLLLIGVYFLRGTSVAQESWWRESVLLPPLEAAVRFAAPHVEQWMPQTVQRPLVRPAVS
jgi:membrane protein required for colicin V production